MKNLNEYINESLTTGLLVSIFIFIIILIVTGVGVFEYLFFDKNSDPSKDSESLVFNGYKNNPNLFSNIKERGLLHGFISWFMEYIIERRNTKETDVDIFYRCACIVKNSEEFKQWSNTSLNKRKLRDLRVICKNIIPENEMRIGKRVIKSIWDEYQTSANHITKIKDIKDIEKEIDKL